MNLRTGVSKGVPFLGLLTVLSALSVTAPAAKAWGCKGHQTVALVAEKHLTPVAKEMLLALLNANPVDPNLKRYCGGAVGDPLADASTWPDGSRISTK